MIEVRCQQGAFKEKVCGLVLLRRSLSSNYFTAAEPAVQRQGNARGCLERFGRAAEREDGSLLFRWGHEWRLEGCAESRIGSLELARCRHH